MIDNKEVVPNVQKRRVDQASPIGRRCLIQQTHDQVALDYCHIIPGHTSDAVLDSLEYAWGKPRFTLNIHTRYNIILLTEELRTLFSRIDPAAFLLLPEGHVLEKYKARKLSEPLPYQPNTDPNSQPTIYKYRLVALNSMRYVPIHRQTTLRTDPVLDPLQREDFNLHVFPYTDLPIIQSHALPHFFIFDAGQKLLSSLNLINEIAVTYPALTNAANAAATLQAHWLRWVSNPIDADWLSKPLPSPPPSTQAEIQSTVRRSPRNSATKRKASGNWSPKHSKKAKKGEQQQDEDGNVILNRTSLRMLEEGSSDWETKQSFISDWQGQVVPGCEGGGDGEIPD